MSFPIITPPTITNGCNRPLNFQQGTVPNMGEAITDWFQKMTFTMVAKSIVGFEVLETPTPTQFWGVLMPLSPRDLQLLPIGQRAWTLFKLFAQPVLTLQVDDVIILNSLNSKQTRVMSRENYGLESYVHYTLCQDYTGSGP